MIHKMQIETIVIGAGPVGLYTAFRLGLLGIESCVIENLDKLGGQCYNLYKDKEIYDLPGVESISGEGLVSSLQRQLASTKKSTILDNSPCTNVVKGELGFTVVTKNGKELQSNYVVICTGAGFFEHRRPTISGIESVGDNVIYSVHDKECLIDRDVLILGGGDSALDWAVQLQKTCRSITLVHRSNQFRANDMLVRGAMESDKITLIMNAQVSKLSECLNKTVATIDEGGSVRDIEFDKILVCFGMVSVSNHFDQWSISPDIAKAKVIVSPISSETNISGLFAAGDCSHFDSKQANLMSGFYQSLQIANQINSRIKNKIYSDKFN